MNQKFLITIDLGKGVHITAPFKKQWSLAEWRRMQSHVDSCIGNVQPSNYEAFK
jgi:DNA primase